MDNLDNAAADYKCVLLSFANKRSFDFSAEEKVCAECASRGYYFEKVVRVAFDNSREIVRVIKDAAAHADNLFLLYPAQMDNTVKSFVSDLLGAPFDGLGILKSGNKSAFTLFCDGANRLNFDDIKAVLDKKYSVSYDRAVIRAVGTPSELLEEGICAAKDILHVGKSDEAFINVSESFGDCRIEIVYTDTTPKMAVDGAIREILKRINAYVYAMEDISLAEQLFRLLRLRRMTIAVAESFTGGGVCKRLVEVPGVSEVFFEGLNTYSNQAKCERLGVKESTLRQYGAVSAETAKEMAEGLLNTGNCTLAVATTGIAGPNSDNTRKPVGLAYIAVGSAGRDVLAYQFNFKGDREEVTQTAINEALFLAYKELK